MNEDYQQSEQQIMPHRQPRRVAPAIAIIAVILAGGAGYYAWTIRDGREQALAKTSKLQEENKSLNDALELLRTSSGDLGSKLTTCKDELTTQTASFDDVDKRRTVLEADLAVCQASVKDLKEQTREQNALLAEFKGLTGKFQRMIDSGKLDVIFRRGKMVVKLPESILFPSGSDELSADGKSAIAEVATILRQMGGRRFTVAGHTDNIPVGSGKFDNNWELSAQRAVKVTELLIDKGVAAGNLVAAGYGPYDPIASNGTATGRQKNRRIEIILEPNLRQLPGDKLLEKASGDAQKAKAAKAPTAAAKAEPKKTKKK
jgi:chemotaxis protein MotB